MRLTLSLSLCLVLVIGAGLLWHFTRSTPLPPMSSSTDPLITTVAAIVADPTSYDGVYVRIDGFYDFGFERSLIVDTVEPTDQQIWLDAFSTPAAREASDWARVPGDKRGDTVPVTVTGRIHAVSGESYGHLATPAMLTPDTFVLR